MQLKEPEEPDADAGIKGQYPRPPGALSGFEFTDRCVQCTDCFEVCPSQAIVMDSAGYPVLLHPQDCGNCGLCADVCSHSAIRLTDRTRAGLKIVLAIESAYHI